MLSVVLKKELMRVFSDRRLVFSTFILPAISIYILYSLMGTMAGSIQNDINGHEGIVFVQNAPDSFMTYYEQNKNDYHMTIHYTQKGLEDYRNDLKENTIDLFVVFEENFDTQIMTYEALSRLPNVSPYYNPNEDYSSATRGEFVYDLMDDYQTMLLVNRFGNIDYVNAFKIDLNDDSLLIFDVGKSGNSIVSMMLPMLLAIILFAGAMGIGMDSIAGEKERGTMATLLVTPAERDIIALGKILSLAIVSIVSACLSFVAILASLPKMSAQFGEDDGAILEEMTHISFSITDMLQLLVLMLTLVGIYVGIISLISVFAKSVKEAGTYISPVYMVIMIAAFTSMYSFGDGLALYKFLIPVYGSINAIKELLLKELSVQEFVVASFSAILVTFILVKLITRAFNSEKVMFNA